MMKVSVILPIYNTEDYLPACLDSLLGQRVEGLEIIAVDNGCTDRCPRILASYAEKDSRVKVVRREHGEVADARNTGLAAARGEYVAFCDSDDTVPAGAYEALLSRAEKTGSDVVVGSHYECTDWGEQERFLLPPQARRSNFQLTFCVPCVWNKLIRRSFLIEHGLSFPPLVMGEDVIFLAKLLHCAPRMTYVMRPIYFYWTHTRAKTPSMTHRYTLDFFKLHLLCRETLLAEMRGTQYQRESEEYVYWGMIYFLRTFLFRIWDGAERQEAFALFRRHVLSFDWSACTLHFESIFNVKLEAFQEIGAEEYFVQALDCNHREIVLSEYYAGLIGFRYILRYIRAWFSYKMTRKERR